MPSQPPGSGDPSGSITILYQQWRQGNPAALDTLLTRLRPRLLGLARKTLSGRIQRATEAEDAIQSALLSFWEGAQVGQFSESLDRDDLWKILGVITMRKALKQQEKERAQKRGSGGVVTGYPIAETAQSPASADAELVVMEFLELLDDELRTYALLRLAGHKNREIAVELHCTERKVERKLNLIRAIWDVELQKSIS